MCGNLEVIELLLKNPKSEYWQCQNGLSPLHFAAKSGHLEAYKLIAKYRDDINPKSDSSEYMGPGYYKESVYKTPLHLAAWHGHLTICQFIVANVEDKNPKGWLEGTPFHSAAMQGHLEICRLLIENSIDKNPEDVVAYTPLHGAAERGHLAVCQLIIENIGHYIHTDDLSKSPFDLAEENGHESVSRFLKDVVSKSGIYKGRYILTQSSYIFRRPQDFAKFQPIICPGGDFAKFCGLLRIYELYIKDSYIDMTT